MDTARLITRLSKPYLLVAGALSYALGIGIVKYLGGNIDWSVYFVGQAWVTILQLAAHFLDEYYFSPREIVNRDRFPINSTNKNVSGRKLPYKTVLAAAFACLAGGAALTVLMIYMNEFVIETYVVMGMCFFGAFFYSVPPAKLKTSGYGELTTALILTSLVPTLAFLHQENELHPLIAMSTFPLVALCLVAFIGVEYASYSFDLWQGKRTLLVRIGWQSGMTLHNLLILSSFLLLCLASLFGLPRFVLFYALLTFPLGLLEIWQMWRIRNGAKPNWKALKINAMALYGSMAYLITFAYWSR